MATSEKVRNLAEGYQRLNDEERHTFAELVAPIDTSEVSQEWLEEIRSRADDIDAGRVKLIDGEEVLGQLRAINPLSPPLRSLLQRPQGHN
jgi:hypothetical protein